MIVGLTGGIGAGKSAVARLLAARGAAVIDTDAIAREVVERPSPVLDRIRETFGSGVIDKTGALDREALAKLVFADDDKRRLLNGITHPEVLKRVLARIGTFHPSDIVVVVVPLLFESGFDRNCDIVVAVVAPEAVRIARVRARDGTSEPDVRARMRAQLPEGEYERRSNIVIRNDGAEAALESEVARVWPELERASKTRPSA